MDNFKELFGIRRMDRLQMHVLKSVAKGVDESILRWFYHIERMENDRIAKRVYIMLECLGNHLVGQLQERCTDCLNNFEEKRFEYLASKKDGEDEFFDEMRGLSGVSTLVTASHFPVRN